MHSENMRPLPNSCLQKSIANGVNSYFLKGLSVSRKVDAHKTDAKKQMEIKAKIQFLDLPPSISIGEASPITTKLPQ